MKNVIIGIFIILAIGCSKESEVSNCNYVDYKYYDGDRDYIGEMSTRYINIGFDSSTNNSDIHNFVSNQNSIMATDLNVIHANYNYPVKHIVVKLTNENLNCEEIQMIMLNLENNAIVRYVDFTVITDDCQNAIWQPLGQECVNYYGAVFYANLKNPNDKSKLDSLTNLTNSFVVDSSSLGTYHVFVDKNSKHSSLQMANYFFETGLFDWSEPGIGKIPVK
ncbi:MAG: hypothetical protein KDC84_03795 [Crocinitomicaceae bacterium]|nr:hypothetical protein [Crocinitomicaceae bacterium]